MGPPRETWPARDVAGGEAARARALAAMREELARTPRVRPWRHEALRLFAAPMGLSLAVLGVMATLGATSADVLARVPGLLLLGATAGVCAWAALAPRGRGLSLGATLLTLGTALTLVLLRGPGAGPSRLPEWVCTVSHVGVGLVPGLVALLALRSAAFLPRRALLAGVSVGTAGAFVGELACEQGAAHVLRYHLSAWALAALVMLVISRLLPPRTFAP
jgi:hypothetical protein